MNKLLYSFCLLLVIFCCMGAGPCWVKSYGNINQPVLIQQTAPFVQYVPHYFGYYSHYYTQPMVIQNFETVYTTQTRFQNSRIVVPYDPYSYPYMDTYLYHFGPSGFRYNY